MGKVVFYILLMIASILIAIYSYYNSIQHENFGGDFYVKKYEVIEKTLVIDKEEIDFNLVVVNTKETDIGITSPEILEKISPSQNYSGYTIQEYLNFGNYKAVQSGGFLSSWSPPRSLGYLKIQGTEYNKVHSSWLTTGLFCTNGNDFKIESYKEPLQFNEWLSCIQGGPLLIHNQKNVLDKGRNTWFIADQKHRQSFLCEDNKGYLIMGISGDVKLRSMVSAILKEKTKGGLGCKNALALNPKGIAGITARKGNLEYSFGSTSSPLPNAIVVR